MWVRDSCRNWYFQKRWHSTQTETDFIRTGDIAHIQKLMLSEQVTQHTNRTWCFQNRWHSTHTETDVIRTGDTAHKQKLMLSEQVTQHTNRISHYIQVTIVYMWCCSISFAQQLDCLQLRPPFLKDGFYLAHKVLQYLTSEWPSGCQGSPVSIFTYNCSNPFYRLMLGVYTDISTFCSLEL